MLNYAYYPFQSDLEEIKSNELDVLRQVPESWHIEYKRQDLGKISDYAKQMSAFANQYGGLLFIGIKEDDKKSRMAEDFSGVAIDSVNDIMNKVREAAAQTSPPILYEERVIRGDGELINLQPDRAVVIIGVPKSYNTPHIHSNGVIYRRVGDQSAPKEETDRFVLDELWKRGQKHESELAKKLTKIPDLPARQESSSWVHLFIKPGENQKEPKDFISLKDFESMVANTVENSDGGSLPLPSIQGAFFGFIARQIQSHDPTLATVKMRWWHDGTVRFDIPINKHTYPDLSGMSHSNKYLHEFVSILNKHHYGSVEVLDCSELMITMMALCNTYLKLVDLRGDSREFFSCFTIRNVFNTAPYVDSREFITSMERYSLPLIEEKDIVIPKRPTERTMFKLIQRLPDAEEQSNTFRVVTFCAGIVCQLFQALGIIREPDEFFKDLDAWGLHKYGNREKDEEGE